MPRKCDICGNERKVMRDEKENFLICRECWNRLMKLCEKEDWPENKELPFND